MFTVSPRKLAKSCGWVLGQTLIQQPVVFLSQNMFEVDKKIENITIMSGLNIGKLTPEHQL